MTVKLDETFIMLQVTTKDESGKKKSSPLLPKSIIVLLVLLTHSFCIGSHDTNFISICT